MFSTRNKNILLISLHSLFTILAVYLVVPLFLSFKNLGTYLSIAIVAYVIISIFIKIIKDIYNKNFPQFLFFFIAFALYYYSIFASCHFTFELKDFSNTEIIYLNSIFVIYLFFDYLIFMNSKDEKIKKYPFKFIYKWNYIVIIISLFFISIFIFTIHKLSIHEIINYSSRFLFAVNPFFNKNLVNLLQKKTQITLKQLNIDVSFYQIGLINTIKTFVFSRKGFIGKQEYELSNIEHRKTLRKTSVLNIAASISKLWNNEYYETFTNAVTDISELEFTVIKKTKDGIIVKNESYGRLIFGFYSFISKYTNIERPTRFLKPRRSVDTHNLYLIKNELAIAKFTIKEKTDKNNLVIADKFNEYGNTVFINDNEIIDFNTDISVFDKAYTCKNIKEEKDILQKLNVKAPTAFITNNKHKIKEQDLTFVIFNKEKIIDRNENIIYIAENKVARLIKISKKISNRINYSLIFFVLLNLILLIFAIFFYKQPSIVLLLNTTISVVYLFILKKLPINFNII